MSNEEKLLQLLNQEGPVLPVKAAKAIGSNTIMASAHLSNLISRKKVKVSKMKVGSSPLYFLPGQEARLEEFYEHLHDREKEAFSILKEKKILKDTSLSPVQRTALRQLRDFAAPLEVTYNNTKELFWKWHSLSDEETSNLIREIITPKPKVEVKPNLPEVKKEDNKPEIKKEVQKKLEKQKKEEKIEKKKQEKPEQKQEGPEKKETAKASSPFINEIRKYFSKSEIEVVEENIIRKDSEAEFTIRVPSSVGHLMYFCKAKSKKRINDGDLSSAFIQGQTKKLPVIFLTKGILSKKAEEMLSSEFKGMTLAKL